MSLRMWDKLGHMGIFLHANSQVKRTLPSRVMAETIFAGPTTFGFFHVFGANYLQGQVFGNHGITSLTSMAGFRGARVNFSR